MRDLEISCDQLGYELYRKVWEAARLRQGLEERWFQDTLQYHGKYDADIEKKLRETEGASRLFVNLTRPKTKVLRARLIDILFPTDEANWDISPTPVPRIDRALARTEGSEKHPLQRQEIQAAAEHRDLAKESATQMRALMNDQMVECGYVDVGRQAISQGCRLGASVIKGPFASTTFKSTWQQKKEKQWSMDGYRDMQPEFSFVDLWQFYPDMDCKTMADCEFVFELHKMSMTALRKMGELGMFDKDTVRYLIGETPGYSPTDPGHFDSLLGWVRQVEGEMDETQQNRYLVFEYHGPISYEHFKALCEYFKKPKMLEAFSNYEEELKTIHGTIWFCADKVLRFDLNPLESGRLPYSVFRLDPTENSLIGSAGVPRMLADPQSSLNAAWRLAMESGGLEGVPMFVIDTTRLDPQTGKYEIKPRKIWLSKTGFGSADGGPPIQPVNISGNLEGIVTLANMSREFMDDEASLPLIAQGGQAAGARQTAHGMTLLANAVNVLFRDSARGFDADITVPNMLRLYEWNMQFSDDDAVKGDMEIKALGSSVLLINELVSQHMMMLMNLVVSNPDAFASLKFDAMLRLWFKTLRLERYGLIMTDPEIAQMREEKAAEPPPVDPSIQVKLQIAEAEMKGQAERLKMEYDVQVMKLAQQENMTLAQVKASIENVRIQTRAKERQFLAEVAVKEKHGEGI